MLSGIVSMYDERHLQRIENEVKKYGGTITKVKMQGVRLDSIMKNHQKHIDYLSIDVEGGELSVLRGIDFNACDITLIGIENNYKDKAISKILSDNGYIKIMQLGCDEFYVKR